LTITLTGGPSNRLRRDRHSTEALGTTGTEICLTVDLVTLPGATATGFSLRYYTMADGVEGQTMEVVCLGTGEAKVALSGTSTGAFVLSQTDDMLALKFLASKWRVIQSQATIATAT
jgi:hypothetical protein